VREMMREKEKLAIITSYSLYLRLEKRRKRRKLFSFQLAMVKSNNNLTYGLLPIFNFY
jgi:hypothetical protein